MSGFGSEYTGAEMMASKTEQAKISRWWGIVVGIGVALSPIHNMTLTRWATNDAGETLFFLPAFGYLIWIMGTGLFLLHYWDKVKESGWGDRKIVVPLLFIVGAIALSGATATGWEARFAPLCAGIALFGLYLMARIVGKDLFLPLAVGAVIGSLGIVAHQLVFSVRVTGGFIFEQNYDIATGYILLGAALFVHRWQWLLAGLAIVALLLSGSPEAIFVIGILGLVVLIRHDWCKKLAVTGITIALLVIAIFAVGWGQSLYSYVIGTIQQDPTAVYVTPDGGRCDVSPLAIRWLVIRDALVDIKPLGDGYNLTGFTGQFVHNVPLIIVQQLGWPGILAGLAWLWVSIWCLIKTKWKYAWILILSLSVFDHFVWTQLAPLWWVLIGVSTTSTLNSDLIFRGHTE